MYVDYRELGRRIAKRRKELGMRQYQVNELAGLSDKYLSNIERATSVPSIDVLMKLCSVLKTTPNDLLLGATNEFEQSEYDNAVISDLHSMTPKQRKAALSLIRWVTSQDFE
ncbi:MAG: helix-turn-helix domain-containing protein [Oscillospiraceae bacterium]